MQSTCAAHHRHFDIISVLNEVIIEYPHFNLFKFKIFLMPPDFHVLVQMFLNSSAVAYSHTN